MRLTQDYDVRSVHRDSAGQERFRAIAGNYYKGSHGVGICFDLTNEKTFENLPLWLTEIEQHADCKPHLVLIGTKTDLKKKRVITRAKAEEFAAAHNMLYIETSAKTSLNVVETFEMITRQLLKEYVSTRLPRSFCFALNPSARLLLTFSSYACRFSQPWNQLASQIVTEHTC